MAGSGSNVVNFVGNIMNSSGKYDTNAINAVDIGDETTYTIPAFNTMGLNTNGPYVFVGWNTNEDGSGTSYTTGDTIEFSGNISLYAQWEKPTEEQLIISNYSLIDLGDALRLKTKEYPPTTKSITEMVELIGDMNGGVVVEAGSVGSANETNVLIDKTHPLEYQICEANNPKPFICILSGSTDSSTTYGNSVILVIYHTAGTIVEKFGTTSPNIYASFNPTTGKLVFGTFNSSYKFYCKNNSGRWRFLQEYKIK